MQRDRAYLTSPFRLIDCVADGSYEIKFHDTMNKSAYICYVVSLFFIFRTKNYTYAYQKMKNFKFDLKILSYNMQRNKILIAVKR